MLRDAPLEGRSISPPANRNDATDTLGTGPGPVSRVRRNVDLLAPIALLVLLGWLAPAAAQETDASALANPYKGRSVSRLSIEGIDRPLADELRSGLALAARRGFPRRKPELYPNTLEADLSRARLWLARKGYPEATIQPVLAADGDEVIVRLLIEAGPARILAGVELIGWPAALPTPQTPRGLASGLRFEDAPASDWARELQKRLREAGFAFATVRARARRADSGESILSMEAQPGPRYAIDEVELRGCADDLCGLARKTLGIEPGGWYSPTELEEAEMRLRLLDLFRQIRLSIEPAAENRLRIVADLVERRPRSIETGAGYWTDELIRVHAMWRHRNLFHAGRGLQVGGSWSLHLREFNVTTWWPGLPVSTARLQLGGSVEDQVEDSYDLFLLRSTLGIRFRHSLSTTSNIALQYEDVDLTVKTEDVDAFDSRGGTSLSVVGSWLRDRADDRLDPTTGSILVARAAGTLPGQPSDTHFLLVEASATRYLRVSERWMLASHVAAGWARPFEDSTDLLPNKRFYSGGASSMRGFARRRLGPVDDEGSPLGGETKFEASTEMRIPLFWRLRAALFFDAGQVWSRRGQTNLGELEYAVGPGLMVATPLGPVRADAGFRLSRRDRSADDVVFHISVGHPY